MAVKSRDSLVVLLYSEIMRPHVFQFVALEAHKIPLRLCLSTLITAVVIGMAACSSGSDAPGMAGGSSSGGQGGASNNTGGRNTSDAGTGGAGGSNVVLGTCTIGTSKSCRVVIGIYNGVESCFVGMQYCDVGTWTPCIDARDAN